MRGSPLFVGVGAFVSSTIPPGTPFVVAAVESVCPDIYLLPNIPAKGLLSFD